MTLSEILIAAALVGVVLVVLMLGMDGIRSELKRRQTIELLDALDRALAAYHKAVGSWPVAQGPLPEPPTLVDRPSSAMDENSGNQIVAMLAEVPASYAVLQSSVPPVLRVSSSAAATKSGAESNAGAADATPTVGATTNAGSTSNAGAKTNAGAGIPSRTSSSPTTAPASASDMGGIRDSWGHPLCCLNSASPSAVHRKAVAANENRPIFISAGPDGDFGFIDPAAAADNLRSDELRR